MDVTEDQETPQAFDGLGPSMTDEFTGAKPLEELVAQKSQPRQRASQTTTQAVSLDPKIFASAIGQVDQMVSVLLNVAPEAEEDLEPIANGIYPLAAHYTGETASVTTLWTVAILCTLTYATLKYSQLRQPEGADDGKGETSQESE